MADIRHRVGIAAPPQDVYEKLATTEGLASWWTRDVTGDTSVGGRIGFNFGPDRDIAMEVIEPSATDHIGWRCVGGPDEWLGTTLTFHLEPTADETVLLFAHAGWRETVEFMHHCSTKWAYFILGLKASLEGGKGTPYPADMPISSWG